MHEINDWYLTELEPDVEESDNYSLDFNKADSYFEVDNVRKNLNETMVLEEGKPVKINVHLHDCLINSYIDIVHSGFINIYQQNFIGRVGDGEKGEFFWELHPGDNVEFSFYLHPDKIANPLNVESIWFKTVLYMYVEEIDDVYKYVKKTVTLKIHFNKNWRFPKLTVHTPKAELTGINNKPFNVEFTVSNRNNSETSNKSMVVRIKLDEDIIYSNRVTTSASRIKQLINTDKLTSGEHTLEISAYHNSFPRPYIETVKYVFRTFHNTAPLISLTDTKMDLGTIHKGFSRTYAVSDEDNHKVMVQEELDSRVLRIFQAVPDRQETIELTRDKWLSLTNGNHKLAIKADDNHGGISSAEYTFRKQQKIIFVKVQGASDCDERPRRMLVTPTWQKDGAIVKVRACNNMNDKRPTWEIITDNVLLNKPFLLSNESKTAEKWRVGIEVIMTKNEGYNQEISLSSIGYAYE